MKLHKYCFFECLNCSKIDKCRLDNIRGNNILYCRDCASAPIIQYFICEDCGNVIEIDNWDINHKRTPYCGTCSASRLAKNMLNTRDDNYIEKMIESKRQSWISRSSLYYGLYNLEYSDREINEIIGNKGFTYWRIKCNLPVNYKCEDEYRDNDGRFKKNVSSWNKDIIGKDSHMYINGSSYEPYGEEFNVELKRKIRKRDNYVCQECKYSEKELGERLSVHHIDYDKKNSNEDNLISLCKSCHCKTNWNRENWVMYYQNKMNGGD